MSAEPRGLPLIGRSSAVGRSRGGRWARPLVGWVVAFVLGVGSAWWAADATLSRPEVAEGTSAPVFYTVSRGTVERVMSFTAKATWAAALAASNSASGTVTSVSTQPGQAVEVGDVLYTVDLRPVVAAEGAVPSFRVLSAGASGEDVAQLEEFLAATVRFDGTVDEEFTELTAAAVMSWQARLGVEPSGVVRPGDLLFLPQLPARVVLSGDIRVGAQVSSGIGAVEVLSKSPSVTVTLGADQSDLVPLDGAVRVHRGGAIWRGRIAAATQTELGELQLELVGPQGRAICHPRCAQLPVSRPTLMRADLIAVPPTTGPVVPAAALRTMPQGATVVLGVDGEEIPVQVLAAASGQAVVSGIDVGERIQLYGDAATSDDESS